MIPAAAAAAKPGPEDSTDYLRGRYPTSSVQLFFGAALVPPPDPSPRNHFRGVERYRSSDAI